MASTSKKAKSGYPKGVFRNIFICSKQELSPFGTVFAFGADNFDEQKLGTIFGVIKIDDHSEDSSYVANLLTSVIKKEYFSKPHRSAEESFETSLRKANLALAELARHGSLGWSEKLNFTGGALERNNLHFACLGGIYVFLVRNGQIAEISQNLEEELETETHPLKTFSNISSGKLEKGDKLIFTTYDLLEIFSKEELRQNAAHFSREEFASLLELSLQANAELAGTIIIDLIDESEIQPVIVETPAIGKIKNIDSFAGSPAEEYPSVSYEATFPDLSHLTFWQRLLALLKHSPSFVSNAAKKSFIKLTSSFRQSKYREKFRNFNPKKSASNVYRLGRKAGVIFASAKNKFQTLESRKKKLLLGVFGGIVAIAIVGMIIVLTRNKKTVEPVSQPGSVPAEARPALALGDTEARAVENIEEVVALPSESVRIAILDGILYAISGKDRSLMRIDADSKTAEEIKNGLPVGNFGLIAAMPHLKSLFLLTEDKRVITFTPINKNFQENGIALPGNLRSQDIKSYLTYLYVLDTASNQVFRYPRAEGGFGEGQAWLRAVADLKNAKGIAINDDLYLAESEKVTAYLQGKQDEKINFDLPQAPLSVDRIYSEPGMEFVYVLDSKNRRVVRFTKDGKISAQYFNESISETKDFVVDEKNKTIYLLESKTVRKFKTE